MKKIGFLSLLVACVFVACSDSDTPEEQPAKRLLTVEVSENPLTDEATGAPALGITRSENYTTTESLNAFSMNYTGSYKYDLTKSGSTWTTNDWPVDNNVKIDFYAYTGGDFIYSAADPYVSFEVDQTVSSQHDLLVAVHKDIAYNDAGGKVSLSFDHACAVVQFNVQLTNTLYGNLKRNLTVNSIVLRNVNNQGQYHYNDNATPSWTLVGELSSFELVSGPIYYVGTEQQRLPCDYLFMIPQSRAANGTTGTYLEVNYTTSAAKTATIPLDINWQAGYLYTINIKLGTTLIKE